MTDNEIIKALECCSTAQNCSPCKYEPTEYRRGTIGCCNELMKSAIDLIKRQQAGIAKAKSEAITEFAGKLKDMHKHNTTSVVSLVTLFGDINKMVKEMTEGINDT